MYVNEATRRTKQSFMCHDGTRLPMYITMHVGTSFDTTLPSPRLMRIPLVRNSTNARFGNKNQIFTYVKRIYFTDANEKHCVLSTNLLSAKFSLSE